MMSGDDRLEELLLRWDEFREQGILISAEELCAECPELVEDVRRARDAHSQMFRIPNGADANASFLKSTVLSERTCSASPGDRFGPYEILSILGAGGMGEVHRARDTRLGRDVAIKLLPREYASDPDYLARFEIEARAVAGLSHPNIVVLFDFGTDHGVSNDQP